MMKKSNEKKQGMSLLLRCLMLIVIAVSLGVFISGMIDYATLTEEKARLEKQKESYEAKIDELNYRLNSPIDYDDIVRIAREKLNLAFPDDTVFYNEQESD